MVRNQPPGGGGGLGGGGFGGGPGMPGAARQQARKGIENGVHAENADGYAIVNSIDNASSMKSTDAQANAPIGIQRKIIYNAAVEVVVEDFAKAEQLLQDLIKTHKGYLAESDVSGSPGQRRSGRWKVRIPTDQYDTFMSALGQVGELMHKKQDSQDVTDEFYDLEARIKNKQTEEKSLTQLLEKTTGKMEDILAVRRELNGVRQEIERMQGRIQVLTNQTAYTTVTLQIQERSRYVDATTSSFGDTMSRTFGHSWDKLVGFGQGLLLVIVALVPWLPVIVVIGATFWFLLRRQRRLAAAAAASVPAASAES